MLELKCTLKIHRSRSRFPLNGHQCEDEILPVSLKQSLPIWLIAKRFWSQLRGRVYFYRDVGLSTATKNRSWRVRCQLNQSIHKFIMLAWHRSLRSGASTFRSYEKNKCFQYIEEWSETNITGNNRFQWCFLTSSQVNWADIENFVELLSKEMHDIKIDGDYLFEEIRRLNVYLNSNKLQQ
ncbi:hypothetical protein TNCV_3715541 [Trichonephila clavipes]|nr:hypothetical protein TNCV_3715541 [Trichonephila clavipes]